MNDRFSAPEQQARPQRPGSGVKAPTSGPQNNAPIGDIELKKKSGTYNTYTIRLSYGQIECLRQSLEKDHANPIADELKALFDYYIRTIPGPGEEEEDLKARDEMNAVQGGEDGDVDSQLPMPPGDEGGSEVTTAGEGPDDIGLEAPPSDDMGSDMGGMGGEEPMGDDGGGSVMGERPTSMPGQTDDSNPADDRLPAPPAE